MSHVGLLATLCCLQLPLLAVDVDRTDELVRPGQREFVVDAAGILSPEDVAAIQSRADRLLTEKATPIIVVTIPDLARYGHRGSIERFAGELFDRWGIGIERINGADWNTGILLLVAPGERQARIELGAGWEHSQDRLCAEIMRERIVPQCQAGHYAVGILHGVEALEAMARGKPLPSVPRPWWHHALIAGFVALVIFTVVSLIRRGSSGWAWLFWAVVLAVIGTILYFVLRSGGTRRGGGGGGGFRGGSFRGGYSGGGGATGSW